jgi:guanine deaminase
MGKHVVRGRALHAPARGVLEMFDAAFVVDEGGTIVEIGRAEAAAGQVLMPGMVDLHVHAPQFPQMGQALDMPLWQWLQEKTFPLEARYADPAFAAEVYARLVDCLLDNGTTTAVYFATIHLAATQALAEICLKAGQRALVGRVAQDDAGQCPDWYRDASAEVAEAETRALIAHVRGMAGNGAGLVRPVITPRFIPACTDDLLARLGRLALESGCHVQTHCSESDWEHGYVRDRCAMSDTAALAGFGLLGRHTVLAHGVFVSEADAGVIRAAGSGIAHCPLSNAYFADAVFPLRRMLDAGVNVGLGTDVAGGASPSVLESARHAVIASRQLESGVDARVEAGARGCAGARVSAAEAFWLATAGGGEVLDLPVGVFRVGYQFDAIRVAGGGAASNLRLEAEDGAQDVLQKVIYTAGRQDICDVWVAGRRVGGTGS